MTPTWRLWHPVTIRLDSPTPGGTEPKSFGSSVDFFPFVTCRSHTTREWNVIRTERETEDCRTTDVFNFVSASSPFLSAMAFRFTRAVGAAISSSGSGTIKPKLSWLDLRGYGLSALERLCLEESLLRHDSRNWAIVGTHDPVQSRSLHNQTPSYVQESEDQNESCVVVMGIGGKPKELLDVDKVRTDGVLVLKRFSGGGTVVLDHNSLWTTFIGRPDEVPGLNETSPRPIMKWSADSLFGPTFDKMKEQEANNRIGADRGGLSTSQVKKTMVVETKSCGMENTGRVMRVPGSRESKHWETKDEVYDAIPSFELRENDYVLADRKIGGNAQSITKDGWLHHTSFLWNFHQENMAYLSLPNKRPDYRGDRDHSEFLVTLSSTYGTLRPADLFASMRQSCDDTFDVEDAVLADAMDVVGDIQEWYEGKCRTKIVEEL